MGGPHKTRPTDNPQRHVYDFSILTRCRSSTAGRRPLASPSAQLPGGRTSPPACHGDGCACTPRLASPPTFPFPSSPSRIPSRGREEASPHRRQPAPPPHLRLRRLPLRACGFRPSFPSHLQGTSLPLGGFPSLLALWLVVDCMVFTSRWRCFFFVRNNVDWNG